jgi:hypothetical protein
MSPPDGGFEPPDDFPPPKSEAKKFMTESTIEAGFAPAAAGVGAVVIVVVGWTTATVLTVAGACTPLTVAGIVTVAEGVAGTVTVVAVVAGTAGDFSSANWPFSRYLSFSVGPEDNVVR